MKEFIEAPKKIYANAKAEKRLIEGSTLEQLKEIAVRNGAAEMKTGALAADSEPMSRCAPKTKNSIDSYFGKEEEELAYQAINALSKGKIVSVDAIVGDGRDGVTARFMMPEQYASTAYGLKLLFGKPKEEVIENPTYTILFFTDEAFEKNKEISDVRKKDATIRLWMGCKRGEQVKICRNSNYMGEGKKGVFQFEDWRVKAIDKKGIFLHAGARRDYLWIPNRKGKPKLREIITAVSGLTATGKTTTLCRKIASLQGEKSEMIGDDGGTFGFKGSFDAFEFGGVYVKTEGLNEQDQPEIYKAAMSKETFLENIAVKQDMPDFLDLSKTANGRAVVARENLGIASKGLRAKKVDYLIILTRNPLMNVISELTPEQAVMQFIYGESIESSGGNPAEAGKFKREFFLDPFMCGDKMEHAMIFYDFLKKNKTMCYLANTGTIGEAELKVTLKDSMLTYDDLLRGKIKFSTNFYSCPRPDMLGYYYPVGCDKADMRIQRAEPQFTNKQALEQKIKDFLKGRQEYLEKIEAKGKIPKSIRESLPYK